MKTLTRAQLVDRRRYFAALRAGRPSIGWMPQSLVLGPLPSATILALCEAIEALREDPNGEFYMEIQGHEQIARCAKRHGATDPKLHFRLSDAIANAAPEHTARVAALILTATGE